MANSSTSNEPETWLQQKTTQAGWVLMVASFGLWGAIPVVPFLPFTATQRVTAFGSLLVVAEIVFWIGALMAGPDAVRRIKSWWNRSPRAGLSVAEPVIADVQERTNLL